MPRIGPPPACVRARHFRLYQRMMKSAGYCPRCLGAKRIYPIGCSSMTCYVCKGTGRANSKKVKEA